ncbi:MAG: AI-2E family transporter [Eubacterium sp.]|nr:AI-2E family transporter [Eubacterium sp.]
MEDPRKNIQTKKKEPDYDLKKYSVIAFIVFLTFCCCILFFFFIYRYHGFAEYWQKLMGILQPIIMGFITAYLLNPVMVFLEKHLLKFLKPRVKGERKAKKMARVIGTVGALAFLLLIIFLLLYMMVPELIKSIQNMMVNLPSEFNDFSDWVDEFMAEDSQLANWLATLGIDLISIGEYLEKIFQNQILPQLKTYMTYVASFTTGVISAFRMFFNFVIGLVIALYLLVGKETFIGQGKKILYAVLPAKAGNNALRLLRVSHQLFGGFISGKIVDSAIIGVICYVGLIILKIPYSLLVAAIVGVTNVVPFFGPFIGAVPSFILIALAEPMKGLYFLVFVLALQQVDGNIIGPKILGDSTGLSSFWVIFAILVGGGLFGFMGMLFGVPTFAVIYWLIREIVAYTLRKRRLPEETRDYIKMENVDIKSGKLHYENKK